MPVKSNNILSLLPVATIILIISPTLPGKVQASRLACQQRLATQAVAAVLGGEYVIPEAGGYTFPGMYTGATTGPVQDADINPAAAQIRIEGADHCLDDYDEEWMATITGWRGTLEKQEYRAAILTCRCGCGSLIPGN